jgi:site-specific DNA recombinase
VRLTRRFDNTWKGTDPQGKRIGQERSRTYYSCERKAHRDCGKEWYDQHPPAARIRADAIHDAVHEFFATRVFGPGRQRLFAETLTAVSQDDGAERERTERAEALRKQIAEERAK